MVVRGREFIVNTIVFGRDRDGRVRLVERVHGYLISPARAGKRQADCVASLEAQKERGGGGEIDGGTERGESGARWYGVMRGE